MSTPSAQPAYAHYQQLSRERVFAFLLRGRMWLIPLPIVVATLVALAEAALWRRVALAVAFTIGISLFSYEAWRYRRRVPGTLAPRPPLSFGALVAMLSTIAVLTGGIATPITFGFPILAIVSGVLTARRTARVVVVVEVVVIWTLAVVAEIAPHGLLAATNIHTASSLHTWFIAVAVTAGCTMGHLLGVRIGAAFDDIVREVTDARDEARALYIEQARTLTTLSGEIAHELKNPLASVKGLAALVAKDAEGKSAEHLAVLRREVDRMQGILEEFLDFSRPLVPLSLAELDLRALAVEVATMHAGAERERGVRVIVDDASAPHVRGDARKLKQILVNLVQNAIDASPSGGVVRIVATSDPDGARVEVRDAGAGLAPQLAMRVFEPGVTGKPNGNGLGLTISRALARQHGGELELANGEVGCIATLRLPSDPIPLPAVPEPDRALQAGVPNKTRRETHDEGPEGELT